MNNVYYYAFYILTKFFTRINKNDKDPAFTSLMILSTPTFLNLLSIIIAFNGISNHESQSRVSIISFFTVLPIVGINYLILIFNKKREKIISFFDEQDKNPNYLKVAIISFYFILSFTLCIHLAIKNSVKEQNGKTSSMYKTFSKFT